MVRIFLLLNLLALSCASNLTHNTIEKDEAIFRNGVQRTDQWEADLKFKRVSWYQGLMLSNDVLYWNVDQFSPFAQWFSSDEKEYFSKCYPLIVTMMYAGNHRGFSNAMMKAELEKSGFSEVALTSFGDSLKAHPEFGVWKLKNHKLNGFCRSQEKSLRGKYIYINVPGFAQTYLEL